jgi:hypothetical protein
MAASDEDEVALLTTALNHACAWFDTHAAQRQNFVSFFLVAMAFLSAAYVGALTQDLRGIAAAVCVMGVAISVAFLLLDLRNRELTRAGERPMRELQRRLADALGMDSLRIIEAVDQPQHRWISHGKVIRSMHTTAILAFTAAGCYALFGG